MRAIKSIILSFLLIQCTVSAYARDDLVLDKEVSALEDFGSKLGNGSCSLAVANVASVSTRIKSACKSLTDKAEKAHRHCATATDKASCLSIVTNVDLNEIISNMRCCIELKNSGK